MISFIKKNTSTIKVLEEITSFLVINDYASALSIANDYILYNGFNLDIHKMRAKILCFQGLFFEAIFVYRDIIKHNSYDFDVLYGLAHTYLQVNNYIHALEIFENLLFSNVENEKKLMVVKDLICLYDQSGDFQKAVELYSANRILISNDVQVLLVVGNAYYEMGDITTAKKIYSKAFEHLQAFNNVSEETKKIKTSLQDKLVAIHFGNNGLKESLLYCYGTILSGICDIQEKRFSDKQVYIDRKFIATVLYRLFSIFYRLRYTITSVSYRDIPSKLIALAISKIAGIPLIHPDDGSLPDGLCLCVVPTQFDFYDQPENIMTFTLFSPLNTDDDKCWPDCIGFVSNVSQDSVIYHDLNIQDETTFDSEAYDIATIFSTFTDPVHEADFYITHTDLIKSYDKNLKSGLSGTSGLHVYDPVNLGHDLYSNDVLLTARALNYLYFNIEKLEESFVYRLEEIFGEQKLLREILNSLFIKYDGRRYFNFLVDSLLKTQDEELVRYLLFYDDICADGYYINILKQASSSLLEEFVKHSKLLTSVIYHQEVACIVHKILESNNERLITPFLNWLVEYPELMIFYRDKIFHLLISENKNIVQSAVKILTAAGEHLPLEFIYKGLYSANNALISVIIDNLIVLNDKVDKSILSNLIKSNSEIVSRSAAVLALISGCENVVLEHIASVSSPEHLKQFSGIFKLISKHDLINRLVNVINAHAQRDKLLDIFVDDLLALANKSLKHFFLAHESSILLCHPPSFIDYVDALGDSDFANLLGSYVLEDGFLRYASIIVMDKLGVPKCNSIAENVVNSSNKKAVRDLLKAVLCYHVSYFFGLTKVYAHKKEFSSLLGEVVVDVCSDKLRFRKLHGIVKNNVEFKLKLVDVLKSHYNVTESVKDKLKTLEILHKIDKREAYTYAEICIISNTLNPLVLASLHFLMKNYPTRLIDKIKGFSYPQTIELKVILNGVSRKYEN